jgi:hypothetical protein
MRAMRFDHFGDPDVLQVKSRPRNDCLQLAGTPTLQVTGGRGE